jgi:branched-chain amino acid transport system substrate-binding protein
MPKKRVVSLVIAIIMLVAGVVAGVGVTYVGLNGGASNATLCSSGKTITIGELLDLSAGLSDQGKKAQDSSSIAITDINAALASSNCNLKFQTAIDDYALDNTKALTQLQSLAASGVQVVVGPLNSGTAQYVLSYANSNHIVLISPSSTSPALAIAGDYLFRTAPNDAAQGSADGRMLWDRGAKSVIIIERHDAYGDGLANATAAKFKALGGTVIDTIPYDTNAVTFTAQVDTIYNDYTAHNSTSNPVAIDAVSFQEFGTIISEMNTQHQSLVNIKMPWFGTDGEAQNSIIANSTSSVGALAAKVRLPSTLYAAANNTKTVAFQTAFLAKFPGVACDTYCLGAYDDVWLAAQSILQAGSNSGTAVQADISSVASNTFGLTGWMGLQPSGDRIPSSYQIWKVVTSASGGTWVLAGSWDQATDSITWSSPP